MNITKATNKDDTIFINQINELKDRMKILREFFC